MKVKSEISFLTKVKLLPVWAATLLSVLFASCSEKQIKNGWYHITDGKTLTFDSSPIVTTVDFEVLRIDSALNSALYPLSLQNRLNNSYRFIIQAI